MNDIDHDGERGAQHQHGSKATDDPRRLTECDEYDETDRGNEQRNKESDTDGAFPKREYCLTKQRRTIDERRLVGHSGYRSKLSDPAQEELGLPSQRDGLVCSRA